MNVLRGNGARRSTGQTRGPTAPPKVDVGAGTAHGLGKDPEAATVAEACGLRRGIQHNNQVEQVLKIAEHE